ncbi:Hemerythrin HHE cation binding domain [Ceratobasidium sp. AG-Ba]|nr:Hemerythrin HHE cation binding domain [Ceratobasidium sp. AG-Ba]
MSTVSSAYPNTDAPEQSRLDYLDEIMVDHNNFRDLHARFLDAHRAGDDRLMNSIAKTLVREVSIHAVGEELSVYKIMDHHGLHDSADHSRDKHQALHNAFNEVDTNTTSSLGRERFAAAVTNACNILFGHAEEEEKDFYPKLSSILDADQRSKLAVEFLKARDYSPSHPHPAAPNTGGITEQAAALLVKPVDAITDMTRSFVKLKHKHASPPVS